MNSCADSCCTCCRRDSSASATLVGWLHRRRGALLLLCVQLLAQSGRTPAQTGSEEKADLSPQPLWTCPQCGGPMVLIERLSPVELRLRSPPIPAVQQP